MASSKVMASSNSRKSDLSRRSSSSCIAPSAKSQQSVPSDHTQIKKNTTATTNFVSMTIDGILQEVHDTPTAESTLLDAQITLIDTPAPPNATTTALVDGNPAGSSMVAKTVDDVWREIVSGDRLECKEEATDDLMTLEDFLAKADAVEEEDMKMRVPSAERISGGVFTFDQSPFQASDKVEGSVAGFGNGVEVIGAREGGRRGKRGHPVLEPLDKAAQQKQRRMIKNRESAARSRERKQVCV